jgi:ribosomal-protein-alanine N-acetyltransferase
MKNIPVIKTPRLVLRPFEKEDIKDIYLWCSSDKCTQYLFWYPHRSIEDTERLVLGWIEKRKHCSFAVTLDGKAIGELEIIKDLPSQGFAFGYILNDNYWHKGYMSEAYKAVEEFMFSNGYSYAYGETDERNLSSRKLLERNGFTLVKIEKDRYIAKKDCKVNVAEYIKRKDQLRS